MRPHPRNLLFFSLEEWNEVWRRNQFFCSLLHQRFPDCQILWICPPIDLLLERSRLADLKTLGLLARAQLDEVAEHPRIKSVKTFKPLPNIIGRSINLRLLGAQVRDAVEQMGWSEYTVWINDHSARAAMSILPPPLKMIYDITDDWLSAQLSDRARNAAAADDDYLVRHSDHVIVCSKRLYSLKADKAQQISLIPNGIDAAKYHPERLRLLTPPSYIQGISNPIVGYVGTLHEDRIDVDLILQMSRALPAIHFVFVGPNCLSQQNTARLAEAPNIAILGAQPYETIPGAIAMFDICMVPHLVNDFTDSLDPLKLYEFAASGKPVISTACSGFRDHPEFVCIAESPAAFVYKLERLLHSNVPTDAGVTWAAQQSWLSRIEAVERILDWN